MTNIEKQPQPHISLEQFGFIGQERGPLYIPNPTDVPEVFRSNLPEEGVSTQLLETDQHNKLLVCSMIGLNPRIRGIAEDIEKPGEQLYGDLVQGFFLDGLKRVMDNGGRGVRTVDGPRETIFYNGNIGVSNGRLLRVYFTSIGTKEVNGERLPVFAKIGASRTKKSEGQLYSALGYKGFKG